MFVWPLNPTVSKPPLRKFLFCFMSKDAFSYLRCELVKALEPHRVFITPGVILIELAGMLFPLRFWNPPEPKKCAVLFFCESLSRYYSRFKLFILLNLKCALGPLNKRVVAPYFFILICESRLDYTLVCGVWTDSRLGRIELAPRND